MSPFVVECVQIGLTSSLITTQNVVVVSHTVCMHVGPKNLRDTSGRTPCYWDMADS